MIQRLRFIFPKTDNFRETRPVICWEHMYGWLDGYGILFDPVVQSAVGVIPEWENGIGAILRSYFIVNVLLIKYCCLRLLCQ